MQQKFLTVDEAAEILGVKKSTLYVWISKGKVPFYKVGKFVRFSESDLAEFLKNKRVEAKN